MNPSKTPLLFALFILQALCVRAQSEFEINNNGLIYADSTISQLRQIVDSLNLKFKVCDRGKTYHSIPQATAHVIKIEERQAKSVKQDIDNGISFDDLIRKYPQCDVHKNVLVTRDDYSENGKQMFDYRVMPLGNQPQSVITWNDSLPHKWIYTYNKKGKYMEESITAFYFDEPFQSITIPASYAQLIQYADCLIDTTATIYTKNAYRDYRYMDEKKPLPLFTYLNTYIEEPPQMPKNDEWDEYQKACDKWLNKKDSLIKILSRTDSFKSLLVSSLKVALEKGGSNDEFEEYVERFISPSSALALKRNRIVVGDCSQDMRPREHAFAIARLAASAVNWEVFLRAHLDIMNDRFQRSSDGSYAWGRRETYIHELEVLDINVPQLIGGIALRVADPASQHYYGSISRVGRALAESKDRDSVTNSLLTMIADPQLDVYNRVLLFYLFLHYTINLQIERERNYNISSLKNAVATLPQYMIEPATQTINRFMEKQ
jgi:hypothetical protein